MTISERHAEAPSTSTRQAIGNPVSSSLNVVVSVPESIEIRMVDASTLADYEVWFFISSVLASAAIGFFVAFIQAMEANLANSRQLGYTTLVFVILLLISVLTTFSKRRLLRKQGRSIRLKATDQITEETFQQPNKADTEN